MLLCSQQYSWANNILLGEGYIGGFEGWKSGNKTYKKIINGTTIHVRGSKNGKQSGTALIALIKKREELRDDTREFIKQNKGERQNEIKRSNNRTMERAVF